MDLNILIGEGFIFIILTIILILYFLNKGSKSECVGTWSECDSECTKRYSIIKNSNNGNGCDDEDGVVKWCDPGEGKCLNTIDHDKIDKVCNVQHNIPQHANINNCPNSGIIAHGNSCDYKCNTGYITSGEPTVECNNGLLQKDNNFKCISSKDPSNNCKGSWSKCGADCMKVYRIDKPSLGDGKHCSNYDGEWAPCTSHETGGRCHNVIHPYNHNNHHHNHNHYNLNNN